MISNIWIEPTEIIAVPTPEEILNWYPSSDPEKKRFRIEVNVVTGERKEIELTLEEYRQRHVNKIISKNEYVVRKQEETRKAKRQALLEKLLDAEEAKLGI
jgi:hypothetical protein